MALQSCYECGNQVSDKASSCPKCGAPVIIQAQKKEDTAPQPKQSNLNPHSGTETNYYTDANGVRITNARFIIGSNTYAMNGISSVSVDERAPKRALPILIGCVGLLLAWYGNSANNSPFIALGLIMACCCIVWLLLQKTKYVLCVSSSGGFVDAYSSTDEDYIRHVVRALNDAIIHRG